MTEDNDINDIIEVRERTSVIADLETLLSAPSYSGLFASSCIYLMFDAFIFSIGFFGAFSCINSLKEKEFIIWIIAGLIAFCAVAYLGIIVWIGLIKIFRRAMVQGLNKGDLMENVGTNCLTYFVSLLGIGLGGIVLFLWADFHISFIKEIFLVFFMLMGLNCLFAIILLIFPRSKILKDLDRRFASYFEKEFYVFSFAFSYLIISTLILMPKTG